MKTSAKQAKAAKKFCVDRELEVSVNRGTKKRADDLVVTDPFLVFFDITETTRPCVILI